MQLALSLLPGGLEALLHVGYNDRFALLSSSVFDLLLPLYLWTVVSAVLLLLAAEFGCAYRTFVALVLTKLLNSAELYGGPLSLCN